MMDVVTHDKAPDRAAEQNAEVRAYWEREPCGTAGWVVGSLPEGSAEWYETVERSRYEQEPCVHSVAQFTRWRGKRVLEVGVGAGADHLQFARAGAVLHGVDLTDAAIETTRSHLALHGLTSDLRRVDAETLPFDSESLDLVYSWGVIHHSAHPERIIAEIHRVLRPGGTFLGMLYARRSVVAFKLWTRHALMRGRPLRSLADVVASHMESPGTKSYTEREVHALFTPFASCSTRRIATVWDRSRFPRPVRAAIPDSLGWFIAVEARR
jgi:ubiquinone/menaquinone biosynthesis C-methylase UbiE